MKIGVMNHQRGIDAGYKNWHVNGYNMIIFFHSDGGNIICNEKLYPITKGGLCFIGSGKYHYTMPEGSEIYDRSKIFIQNEDFKKISALFEEKEGLEDFFNSDSIVYAKIPQDEMQNVDGIFGELERYSHKDKYGGMVFAGGILRLLVYVSENTVDSVYAPRNSMNKAIEYINSNIYSDISIDKLCGMIHMSKYHFCRTFKRVTGMTVMDYVLKTRIVLAKSMLIEGNLSVSEVGERCGFSSTSYFCRAFKEETSLTPLKYRKERLDR